MARPAERPPAPLLLEADCLQGIPEVLVRAGGSFDLVYVDPPFNAGGRRRARSGSGPRVAGPQAYDDAWGGLDAFLAMLEPRLAVMRDALSSRGSLFLHLDHRAVHDAKVMADRVFGRSSFQGEIVWVPGNGARRRSGPAVTHQTILVYSRCRDMIWNTKDAALREPFASTSLEMHFGNRTASGRRFRARSVGGKTYRYYEDEGRLRGSVWTDCPAMVANTPLRAESTGYPTQKPLSLLDRIVRAASLPDSRVLDPMCGSGTTLVAAARLGRAAAGIDQSPLACRIARERLARADAAREAPRTPDPG